MCMSAFSTLSSMVDMETGAGSLDNAGCASNGRANGNGSNTGGLASSTPAVPLSASARGESVVACDPMPSELFLLRPHEWVTGESAPSMGEASATTPSLEARSSESACLWRALSAALRSGVHCAASASLSGFATGHKATLSPHSANTSRATFSSGAGKSPSRRKQAQTSSSRTLRSASRRSAEVLLVASESQRPKSCAPPRSMKRIRRHG
mmetsp:Transcript_50749/g.117861  ORF Transcript_50749/g.117861 Transcript_50749/m.117861 type:complete len:210 (+) Transcript_50749:266-895(+)